MKKKLSRGVKQQLKKKKVLIKSEDFAQIKDKKNQTVKTINQKSLASKEIPKIQWIYEVGDLCQVNMSNHSIHKKLGIILDVQSDIYLFFTEGQVFQISGSSLTLVNNILPNIQ